MASVNRFPKHVHLWLDWVTDCPYITQHSDVGRRVSNFITGST